MNKAFNLLYKPGIQIAFQLIHDILRYFTSVTRVCHPPRRIKEPFMTDMKVLRIPANLKLFSSFDKKFQQLIEADLFNFYMRDFDRFIERMKVPRKHNEPFKVLILEELEAGFVVCIVLLAISMLVFAIEWFV